MQKARRVVQSNMESFLINNSESIDVQTENKNNASDNQGK